MNLCSQNCYRCNHGYLDWMYSFEAYVATDSFVILMLLLTSAMQLKFKKCDTVATTIVLLLKLQLVMMGMSDIFKQRGWLHSIWGLLCLVAISSITVRPLLGEQEVNISVAAGIIAITLSSTLKYTSDVVSEIWIYNVTTNAVNCATTHVYN